MADPVSPVPMPESAAPSGANGRRGFWRHPMIKRAPLILIAAVGIWLWRSSGTDRELIWQIPPESRATTTAIEIQLRDESGKVVKREEFNYPSGAPSEIIEHVRLKDGAYDALVFLTRGGKAPTTLHIPVTVEGETIIERLP